MTRAKKIRLECGEDLINISSKLERLGVYYLFYTHTYEQKDEEGMHLLVIPNDPRFNDAEFFGLIVDLIRDYAENMNLELHNNPLFTATLEVLKKLENGKGDK